MFSFFSFFFCFLRLKCGFFSISGCFCRLNICICCNVLLFFGFIFGLFSLGFCSSFKSSKLGSIAVLLQDITINCFCLGTGLLRRLQGRPSPAEALLIGHIHPFSNFWTTEGILMFFGILKVLDQYDKVIIEINNQALVWHKTFVGWRP